MLIGVVVGGVAGYFGGVGSTTLLMRLTEVFQTIPSFIFAILLVAILSPSIKSVIIAIASSPGRRWPASCAANSWPRRTANSSRPASRSA